MSEQKSPENEVAEGKFKIGDHVKTDAQDLTYYGYVKEIRPYVDGGLEYNVDFYSYAQGKTWVVEWRLEKAPEPEAKSPTTI